MSGSGPTVCRHVGAIHESICILLRSIDACNCRYTQTHINTKSHYTQISTHICVRRNCANELLCILVIGRSGLTLCRHFGAIVSQYMFPSHR
jgi:hypothetical protein